MKNRERFDMYMPEQLKNEVRWASDVMELSMTVFTQLALEKAVNELKKVQRRAERSKAA